MNNKAMVVKIFEVLVKVQFLVYNIDRSWPNNFQLIKHGAWLTQFWPTVFSKILFITFEYVTLSLQSNFLTFLEFYAAWRSNIINYNNYSGPYPEQISYG